MNKYLTNLVENNNDIKIKNDGPNWRILNLWKDDSISLLLKKWSKKHQLLENIIFPEELAWIHNIKKSELEFTYWAAHKKNKLQTRKFDFIFKWEVFKCWFKETSKSLEYIIESFNEEDTHTLTEHRNLSVIKKHLSLYKKHKEIKFMSFYIEWNLKKIDYDFVALAKSLNFYMQLFHRKTPSIIIYKKEEKNEQFKHHCEYEIHNKFPKKINSVNIDPTLLDTFMIANQTNNVRLKFIFYYQVLEFCSYYYLDNKIQDKISGILKNPRRYDDPEYFSKAIIENMKDHFWQKNDSANLKRTINENVSIEDIKKVLEANKSFFCRDLIFDWWLEIPKILKDEESVNNLIESDLTKIKENIERVRNVLVHLRETRENKVILPTEKNNNLLLPYLYLLRRIAELVAINSSST